jgi:nucleoside-diphosphate-sugar epimerase
MRVFVTGATGFVGSKLVELLESEPQVDRIICLARSCSEKEESQVKWIAGDLCADGWQSRVGPVDAIVHVAANASFSQRREEAASNIASVRAALAFAESNNSKFIFISSIGAVDRVSGDAINGPLNKSSVPSPRSAYGRSKLEGERLVEQSRLAWTIIRPAWIYGPGMRRSSHLVQLARMVRGNSFLSLFAWPGKVSVVHVDDLCFAIRNILCDGDKGSREKMFAASQSISFGQIFRTFGADIGKNKAGRVPVPTFPFQSLVKRFHAFLPIQLASLFVGYLTCDDARFLKLLNRKPKTFDQCFGDVSNSLCSARRKWLITGAGSGIGKALFGALEKAGICVIGVDKEFPHDPERTGKHILLDLTLPDASARLGELVEHEMIDIVVNNAGVAYRSRFEDLGVQKTAEMLAVNVVFPTVFASEILKYLRRRGGSLVNVASSVAGIPLPGMAVYSAAKSFIEIWSLAIAAEAGKEMQIVTVWPTGTKTDFQRRAGVKTTGALLDPDHVAERIRQAVERNVTAAFIGPIHVRIVMALGKLLPKRHQARLWGGLLDVLR